MAKQGLTYTQILSDLKKGDYKNIYLLAGEEPYYIDKLTDFFHQNVLDESQREFDLTIVYGKDTDMLSIVNIAKRYPMMSSYQVVIVKEAQQIKDWEPLQYYLQKPLKSTILVFAYKYSTPDKRRKWFQEIEKSGIYFASDKLRDYELGKWISEYVRLKNISVDDKVIAMLSDFLGNDLSKIVNELDKLILTLPKNSQKITPELIEKNIGISKDYNVFELQAAFINKDILKANRIIKYFGENKKANPFVVVLSQLFNFFSNLMIYHYLADKSQGSVASELKINPYFVKDYERASKIYNARKTMDIISLIRETDARGKGIDSNGIEEIELYKELIFIILH